MMRRGLAVLAAIAVGVTGLPLFAEPARAIQSPVAFSSVALPTWQTNGVVFASAAARGLVFVGGEFTRIRPPGTVDTFTTTTTNDDGSTSTTTTPNPVTRPRLNFAVFDAATGEATDCLADIALTSAPDAVTIRSLNVSPDGRTLYVGGYFDRIAGVARNNVAALDIATCTVVSSFNTATSGFVRAIDSSTTTVYLGGGFGTINGLGRLRVAAVNAVGQPSPGAVTAFNASFNGTIRDGVAPDVYAVALKPDNSVLVVGGIFETVNGADSRALGVVDAATGSTVKAFPGFIPGYVNASSRGSAVKALAVDDTGFYTGHEGGGRGIFDGRIAVDWETYVERWRDGCLGATQAVVARDGLLYSASHAHDCTAIGAYGDGPRRHFLAETTVAGADGLPRIASWFPDSNDGAAPGIEGIGPRTLTIASSGSSDYMWSGGEFTTVNGISQQGLTRFGRSLTAGPTAPPLSATSTQAGQVTVAWRTSLDNDDSLLTYQVYRDGGSAPVHTTTGSSLPWTRPQLTWVDTNQVAGTTHTYRVTASDGTNTSSSLTQAVTVASVTSNYGQRIGSDGPLFHLRYDEASGTFLSDSSGQGNNFRLQGGATYQLGGALGSDPSSALSLSGDAAYLYSEKRFAAPSEFSVETWFKTSTALGGKLIGFGDSQTIPSAVPPSPEDSDKHLYMTDSGQLVFGTEGVPGTKQAVTSPGTYRNDVWHHAVATQGPSGMTLYVDGIRVARNAVTTNRARTGYWRVGGDSLAGWPAAPGDGFFAGSLDETAVYERALTQTEVAEHYALGGGVFQSGPADYYGKTVFDDEPLLQWRLNDAVGPTVADATGAANSGTYSGTVTYQRPGAVAGTTGASDRSVRLNGMTGLIHAASSSTSLSSFTTEAWVRTASTTGGQIVGFGTASTGDSATQDRKVWFRNDGAISFGVRQGTGYYVVTSPRTYNDDAFHHVVATRSADTMALWVDGQRVAWLDQAANQTYTGYWRFGGDSFAGWPGAPTSKYLDGYFDELAVYAGVLPAAKVAAHYSAGVPTAPDVAAPTTPAGLSVGLAGPDGVLSWRASVDNRGITGYEVHRSAAASFTPSAATLLATRTTTSYTDAGISKGTWYYRVVATDAAGNRTASNQASLLVTDVIPPSTPTGVTAVGGPSTAAVSWSASTDNMEVAEYQVYRSGTGSFTPSPSTLVGVVSGTSYSEVPPGNQVWHYRIVARDTAGNVSPPSAEVSAVISDTTAPSDPSSLVGTTSGETVHLSWPASTDDVRVTGYDVHRSASAGYTPTAETLLMTAPANSATDRPGVGTWYYRVFARDAVGNVSGASPEVRVFVATTQTVTPASDTWANQGNTSQINAGTTTLVSRKSIVSPSSVGAVPYLRFVVPPTPAGIRLTAAVLRLHTATQAACGNCPSAGSVDTHAVRFADDAWDETTLNWNNRPAFTGTPLGTVGATADNTSYDTVLDVARVQAVTGTQITLGLESAGSDNLYLYSANIASPALRPQLLLSFAPEGFDPYAPTQPTGLAAARTSGTVRLTWTPSTDDSGIPQYHVYRSATSSFVPSPETHLGSVTGTSFNDLPGMGSWYYKLIAHDAQGHLSPPSDPLHIVVPDYTPPTAATALTASHEGRDVSLAWTASTDDVGVQAYEVHRGTTADFDPSGPGLGSTTGTTFTDEVAAGTYFYKVVAHDAVGNAGPPSAPVRLDVVDGTPPSKPTDLVGAQSGQEAQLSWSASTDAFGVSGYQVHRGDLAGFTPDLTTVVQTVTALSYTDSSAPVGTVYYKLVALDPSGNPSEVSDEVAVDIIDVTPPAAPTAVTATTQVGETVDLTWHAATDNVGVTSYTVHRGSVSAFAASASNVLVSDLTDTSFTDAAGPGTWYYRVVAHDAAGHTGPASAEAVAVIADTTNPSDPADLVASASGATVDLSWTASTDDVSVMVYEVHRASVDGFSPTSDSLVTTVDRTSASDRPGDGSWYYHVVAVDSSGNPSGASNQATATLVDSVPPTVPADLVATQTDQPVDLVWTASEDDFGVLDYRIYRSQTEGFTPDDATNLVGTVTDAGFTEPDVPFGTWYYRVVARDAKDQASEASAPASIVVGDRTAPTAPTVTHHTADGPVALSWTGATDATGVTGYEVHRSDTAGFEVSVDNLIGSTSFSTHGDDPGAGVWYYRVVALDAAGNRSEGSDEVAVTVDDTTAPTAPTGVTATQDGAAASLSWTAATDDVGVTAYEVHRSAAVDFTPTEASKVGSTTGTSFTNDAAAGTWHYRVVAKDSAGHATASSEAMVVIVDAAPPTAPGALSALEVDRSVELSWTASTDAFGVQGYVIHRSQSGGFTPSESTRLLQVPATSYTDLIPGTGTWYYRVIAVDPSGGASPASDEVSSTIADIEAPQPPTVSTSATGGTIELTWTGASDDVGVVAYEVHRSSSPSFTLTAFSTVATVTVSSLSDMPGAGTWYYRVAAKDAAGNLGHGSEEVSAVAADVAAPTGPVSLTATSGSTTVALAWTSSTDDVGVTVYQVHRSKLPGFIPSASTLRATTAETTYTDTPPIATWYYVIVAADAAGNTSPASPQATAQIVGAPTVVTLSPAADAYANQAAATTNYGTDASLLSRGTTTQGANSYLRFVLPAAPAGTELTQAVLKLRTTTDTTAGSADTHTVKIASDSWVETSLNWNNRPAVTGATLGSISGATALNKDYQTALDAVALRPLVGKQGTLAVQGSTSDGLYFWSRNHATVAGRPTLVLTYQQLDSDTDGPTQPTAGTATVSGTSMALSWTASVDDTAVAGYDVHRSSTAGFTPSAATRLTTVTATTYTDTPGVGTWHYRIVARDTLGQASPPSEPFSGTIPDTTAPTAPGAPTVTVTGQTVSLSWTEATDAIGVTGYDVHRSAMAGFTPGAESKIATVVGLSTADAPGTGTWYYRVIAHDAATNSSPASGPATAVVADTTPPTSPGDAAAVVSGQQVDLTWTAGTDNVAVTGYEVYRSATTPVVVWAGSQVGSVSGTSFTDLPGAGAWFYVVVARDAAGSASGPSGEVSAVVPDVAGPSQPGVPSGSESAGDVSLSWAASSDNVAVTGYRVYRGAAAGFSLVGLTPVGSPTEPSFVDVAAGAGTWHYRVVAHDAVGNDSLASDEGSVTVADSTVPSKPGAPVATVTDSTVALSWAESTDNVGVSGYDVHRSSASGFTPSAATKVGGGSGTSFEQTVAAGTWHYVVVARDVAGNASVHSDETSVPVVDGTGPSKPGTPSVTVADGTVSLGWTGSTDAFGVTGYDVHRSAMAGFTPGAESKVATVVGLSATDTPGVGTWYYAVIARDASGHGSPASDEASATIEPPDTTPPTSPGDAAAVVSGQQVDLTWTAGTDNVAVTGYEVYRSATTPVAVWAGSQVGSVSGTSFTDLPGLGTWFYVVVARDAAGSASGPSGEVSAVLADTAGPTSPGTPTATVTGTSVALAWAHSEDTYGVTGYDVHRSATSGFTPAAATKIRTVSGTSGSDSPGAGTWYYRIVATDAAGNASNPSGQAAATVAPVLPPTVVALSPTADAFGNAGAATTNYGTNASLLSRGTSGGASYLRFSLPAAPAGQSLTGAVLRFRTTTDTTAGSLDGHQVRIAGDAWTEAGLTWNNRPAITGSLLGTISGATAVNTPYSTTISPAVLAGVLGTQQTLGVTSTGTDSLYLWSRDFGTVASRPQLVLTFESVSTDGTPPTAPSDVTSSVSGPSVVLTWTASTDDTAVSGYDVHRSPSAGFTPSAATRVGTLAGTSFTEAPGQGTWYYRVVAKDPAGNASAASSDTAAVVADGTPPSAPGTPAATVAGSTVSLAWAGSTDAFGVTGYELHRSATSGFSPTLGTLVTTVGGTSTSDSPGTGTWYYVVTAKDAAGNASPPSGQAPATVAATTPTVVTLSPTADAFGNSGAATTNYGTNASLLSRGAPGGASYLRFVFPAAPAGKSLTGALLRFRTTTDTTAGSADSHTVKVGGDSWTETGLTWNNRPPIAGTLLGTISGATAVNTQYEAALTPSSIAALLGTTQTLGIASAGSDSLYLWSRNFGTVASRPQLVLTFS